MATREHPRLQIFMAFAATLCGRNTRVFVRPRVPVCKQFYLHGAVCSTYPIGGLIEMTMVVAPVNDNA